jgi:hypothetical protein
MELSQPMQLTTEVMIGRPESIYTRNSNGEFLLKNNFLHKGFLPEPNKKYVFSCWIKDNQKNNLSKLDITINGSLKTDAISRWPLVEGWKRIEVEFNTENFTTLNILLQPQGSSLLIDDIRIYPADGQMKSYAYNASNLRLMAELDENNFATFYDYDNEGIEYIDITGYNFIEKDNKIYIIDFGDAEYSKKWKKTNWFLEEFLNGHHGWNPDFY